ncbi:MAG: hypothetical protein ABI597_04030 [Gammaproteobacteria bacterium]
MFFRQEMFESSDSKAETDMDGSIQLRHNAHSIFIAALTQSINLYDSKQTFIGRIAYYVMSETPIIALMRKLLLNKHTTLENLCDFLKEISKVKSDDASLCASIALIKSKIIELVEWDIFKLISGLEKFNRATSNHILCLFKQPLHTRELQFAIDLMLKDCNAAAPAKSKNVNDFTNEKYWESDLHWESIFADIQCAALMTKSISLLCKLEGIATADNCHKIYATHNSQNIPKLFAFERRLVELVDLNLTAKSHLLAQKSLATSAAARLLQQTTLKQNIENLFATLKNLHHKPFYHQPIEDTEVLDEPPAYSDVVQDPAPDAAKSTYVGTDTPSPSESVQPPLPPFLVYPQINKQPSLTLFQPSAPPADQSEESDVIKKPSSATKQMVLS